MSSGGRSPTLSNGEQTKVLLAALFLNDGHFLLIDEPTNHLDMKARETVSAYLKRKKGFILISHDRCFLDGCVDHILAINRSDIEVQSGNFSSWFTNFQRQQGFELARNAKLKKDHRRPGENPQRGLRPGQPGRRRQNTGTVRLTEDISGTNLPR